MALAAQVAAGVLLLLGGIAIYLLFRSQTIVLYQWCMHLGLAVYLLIVHKKAPDT